MRIQHRLGAAAVLAVLVSLAGAAQAGRALPAQAVANRAQGETRAAAAHPTPMGMPSTASSMDLALERAMAGMDSTMMRVHLTGKPDSDFARMMIPHHDGAIAMAEAELLYGSDPRLRRIAQEIIVTQESEIAVMRFDLAHPWMRRSGASG